jgi:transcriptional regulator with XRE-family HTH domain
VAVPFAEIVSRGTGHPARFTAADLLHWRRCMDLTQADLAAALGVTPKTVYRWERGDVPIPHIVSLALDTLQLELA